MPGTYSQLLLHVVFSTKGRTPGSPATSPNACIHTSAESCGQRRACCTTLAASKTTCTCTSAGDPTAPVSDLMRTGQGAVVKVGPRHIPETWRVRVAGRIQRLFRKQIAGGGRQKVYCRAGRASQEGGLQVGIAADSSRSRSGVRREVCVRLSCHLIRRFLCPWGAELRQQGYQNFLHGLRCAPPVATIRGPAGAEILTAAIECQLDSQVAL